MKNTCIEYHDAKTGYTCVFSIHKFVHLTKLDADTTIIHLDNGVELKTPDSIRTLSARIDIAGRQEES